MVHSLREECERMKLKTLKDLEQKHEWAQMYFVDTEILRQEAIKRIKDLIKQEKYYTGITYIGNIDSFHLDDSHYEILIHWMKNFFNIKKEELK